MLNFISKGNNMTNKTKLKLRRFTNFQRQERILEPMKPEEHKYLKELLQTRISYENIPRNPRGSLQPQHI